MALGNKHTLCTLNCMITTNNVECFVQNSSKVTCKMKFMVIDELTHVRDSHMHKHTHTQNK